MTPICAAPWPIIRHWAPGLCRGHIPSEPVNCHLSKFHLLILPLRQCLMNLSQHDTSLLWNSSQHYERPNLSTTLSSFPENKFILSARKLVHCFMTLLPTFNWILRILYSIIHNIKCISKNSCHVFIHSFIHSKTLLIIITLMNTMLICCHDHRIFSSDTIQARPTHVLKIAGWQEALFVCFGPWAMAPTQEVMWQLGGVIKRSNSFSKGPQQGEMSAHSAKHYTALSVVEGRNGSITHIPMSMWFLNQALHALINSTNAGPLA